MPKYTDDDVQELVAAVRNLLSDRRFELEFRGSHTRMRRALTPFEPDPWEVLAHAVRDAWDEPGSWADMAKTIIDRSVELGLVKRVEDQP